MMAKMKLVGALSAMTFATVMGQSCVQLSATEFSSCPCEDAMFTFALEGETTVEANRVNLALVLDGSGSITAQNDGAWDLEKGFAVDTVAAFAARNLFDNGGTASYVQFAGGLVSSGTFFSAEDFNDFAAGDAINEGNTVTSIGIDEGTRLLGENPASASFMIVITDGGSNAESVTVASADAARAAGIIVFSVGVGVATTYSGVERELLGIAGGDPANVFHADDFDVLEAVLDDILSTSGASVIPCPSTGATLTIEFSVPVDSTSAGSISGNTVTFSATDLEGTPAEFDVLLELCSATLGDSIVVSADYIDDQGNTPDLSLLTGLVVDDDSCTSPTPLSPPVPTPSPIKMSEVPTAQVPTPNPTKVAQVPTPHPTTLSVSPTPHPTKLSTVPTPHPTTVSVMPTPHPTKLSGEPTPHPTTMSQEPTPYPTKMEPEPTPCPVKTSPEPTPHPTKLSQVPTPHPTKLSQVPTPYPPTMEPEPTPYPTKLSQVPNSHPTTAPHVPTPHPTKLSQVPTPHPTKMSQVPTPYPTKMEPEPTPCPDYSNHTPPKLGEHLMCGSVKHAEYLGCYVDEAQDRALKGPMSSSPTMTTEICADSCSDSGYEYFGTAYSSDCHCGDTEPTSMEGVCNYECFGDTSRACGGVGTMSIYKSDEYGGH